MFGGKAAAVLDSKTKARIDSARDILVVKVPDPKSQVEQINIALIVWSSQILVSAAGFVPGVNAALGVQHWRCYDCRRAQDLPSSALIS